MSSSSSSSYSSSLHFLPTTNITGRSHRRSINTALIIRSRASSPPPITAPQEPSATKSNNSRLDPRVEKGVGGEGKDKYWVLKEEYRQGINPQEKIKLEKEPMGLFMDGGINELASIPFEEIDKNKGLKDDVDVRLKWLGLFHRRKHQYGRFMMRLKLPNGVATSDQVRYLADVISAYGTHGCADVTTRQNFQIRGVELPDVPNILNGLASVGLNSLQSGMDNVRNPVGNPLAGIDPVEIVDTRPYSELLSKYITGDGRGNPDVTNLPRKWNVCVVGSHDLYEHPHINDLAYMPATKDGRFGFNLLVGGFFSPKRCAEAVPMDAWIPGDDVVAICKAILETYRDLGTRGNRQKTRMMWLIDELGIEVFRSEVEQRMPEKHLERSSPEELVKPNWVRRDYIGVHQQKQPDLSFVGLNIPVGRLQASEMYELARLADSYGTGELRLTVEQNVIIPNIPNSRIQSFLSEPLFTTGGRHITPEPEILMRNLVACTGSEFCGQAIIETKARAMRITEEVSRRVALVKAVRMHWTGCPNSCGQVQVADLGFMGCLTKDSQGRRCEGADVYVGGKVGGEFCLGELYKKGVACDELVDLIVDILVHRFGAVKREREEDQDD